MELLNGKKPGGIAFACIRLAALGLIISTAFQVGRCEVEPTESQCRPYIEKALKEQHVGEAERTDEEWTTLTEHGSKEEDVPTDELSETIEASRIENQDELRTDEEPGNQESEGDENSETKEDGIEEMGEEEETKDEIESAEKREDDEAHEEEAESEGQEEGDGAEVKAEPEEEGGETGREKTADEDDEGSEGEQRELTGEEEGPEGEEEDNKTDADGESREAAEQLEEDEHNHEESQDSQVEESDKEGMGNEEESKGADDSETGQTEETEQEIGEPAEEIVEKTMEEMLATESESADEAEGREQEVDDKADKEADEEETGGKEEDSDKEESAEANQDVRQSAEEDEEQDLTPEEDLTKEALIPENLRARDHIIQILRLDEDSVEAESTLEKAVDSTLKSLKGLYDSAIKPLEILYKYRDLSNRHFGDPEIFSKPLILFMGPWSGGKSTTINYLLDNEFTKMSLRTGAEPSPAYFNILMYGEEEEVLDGTQLAADWTFSGLQKFGQSLLDRLKGYKLPNRLLEKVNIVEIPGILEIRKQVQRLFPFNDACQWFIDRADIIFLVYDPSKLDVGPETEAILDQLKGREYQTRIILNKADQVKPEELMRVQGTLIWNISPLMSSTEPPVMYTTSLWSLPYESGAPTRLLSAQEKAFLRDLRDAIDKRVENKIASARRFAVRVRNHAKMVDCYLTTYYNHKTFFGNKKKISDDIIENPQKYHIYEGLSTLTNISRYDLPDPDVYRDFFKLNSLYDFKKLSDTCTYFRGCPINTLDVAIAYDLPELVGKYKKAVEASKAQTTQKSNS